MGRPTFPLRGASLDAERIEWRWERAVPDADAEQRLIQELARNVANDLAAARAPDGPMQDAFDRSAVDALVSSGLWGLACPPELGGCGSDLVSLVVTSYELGRVSGSLGLSFVTHSSVCRGLHLFGSESLAERILPALAGGAVGAFAVHESASGAVSTAVATRVEDRDEKLLVTGSKFFVTNGSEADVILVLARSTSPADGFSVILLEGDSPGLTRLRPDKRMGLNGVASCEILFEKCELPRSNLLGHHGQGLEVLKQTLVGYAFFGAAAISLGLAESSLSVAMRHASERTIGGKPIGTEQAVRLMIAEMDGLVSASRALLWQSLSQAGEAVTRAPLLASRAKRFISEAAVRVTDLAIQVCGGHGYSSGMPLERNYRDARGLTLHYKTTELLGIDLAAALTNEGGLAGWPA